jgi:hypothetical protein
MRPVVLRPTICILIVRVNELCCICTQTRTAFLPIPWERARDQQSRSYGLADADECLEQRPLKLVRQTVLQRQDEYVLQPWT